MNKFKFGDHVQAQGKPEKGVITDYTEYWGNTPRYFVLFENSDTGWFKTEELKLVPHPDTARLDFLIERGEAAFKQNEAGNWRVYDPHSYCQMAAAKWRGFGNSPRAAIDAAIQQSE